MLFIFYNTYDKICIESNQIQRVGVYEYKRENTDASSFGKTG